MCFYWLPPRTPGTSKSVTQNEFKITIEYMEALLSIQIKLQEYKCCRIQNKGTHRFPIDCPLLPLVYDFKSVTQGEFEITLEYKKRLGNIWIIQRLQV